MTKKKLSPINEFFLEMSYLGLMGNIFTLMIGIYRTLRPASMLVQTFPPKTEIQQCCLWLLPLLGILLEIIISTIGQEKEIMGININGKKNTKAENLEVNRRSLDEEQGHQPINTQFQNLIMIVT